MEFKKVSGIVAATITPFTQAGKIDFGALDNLNDFLVDKGVQGLFPCGSTGEGVLMNIEERKAVAQSTLKRVAGRIPVIIHTGALRPEEAIELTKNAKDIGAAGAGLIPPYYYNMDSTCIYEYYRAVANVVPDFPIYIYNIPSNVKNVVTPEVLARLNHDCPNVIGVKDSSMDLMSLINYKQAVPNGLRTFMGNDAQIYSWLAIGGNGAVAATATVFPEVVVSIYKNWVDGNFEKALQAQDQVIKLRAIFRGFTPIAAYKKVLEWQGIHAGIPRSPLRGLTEMEASKLHNELEKIGFNL